MTSDQFCYWLQGYFELNGESPYGLNKQRTDMVREHLALVFNKVTNTPVWPGPIQSQPYYPPQCIVLDDCEAGIIPRLDHEVFC